MARFSHFSLVFLYFFSAKTRSYTREERSFSCNEPICGTIVSKCLLLKSCNCTIDAATISEGNCRCCADCQRCLGDFHYDCCSCVGLCEPKRRVDARLALRSVVSQLQVERSGYAALFEQFVAKNASDGFVAYTYLSLFDKFTFKENETEKNFYRDEEKLYDDYKGVNCSVLYLKKCVSIDKCQRACESLGATFMRWFHTGCCECVGRNCINFGSRENRCTECTEEDEEEVAQKAREKLEF